MIEEKFGQFSNTNDVLSAFELINVSFFPFVVHTSDISGVEILLAQS